MVQQRGQGSGAGGRCRCGCGSGAHATGGKGMCACSVCGHQVPHQPGVPCRDIACPQCGGAMIRRI